MFVYNGMILVKKPKISFFQSNEHMLPQSLKKEIQQAYSQLLKNKSLKPRLGQKQMIAEIARSLFEIELDGEGKRTNQAGISAIEAGTGTGKTVAYTLAVLPIARALKKKVVISTATVALQAQILKRDLPDIQKHSGLQFQFALAKGRGRYLCLSKLDLHMNGDLSQHPLFGAESFLETEPTDKAVIDAMAASMLQATWDGDRDEWPDDIDDKLWTSLTSDRNQCSGRRCQHVAQCSFIKARENLTKVDCVVANHDLVMADLALGGGAILPDPSETIYIFDEAHHLPDIALRHFSAQVRINGSLYWFDQAIKDIARIQQETVTFHKLMKTLDDVPAMLLQGKTLFANLKPIVEEAAKPITSTLENKDVANLPHYRFPQGEIPSELQQVAKLLVTEFSGLSASLESAHNQINDALESNDTGLSLPVLEMLYAEIGQMLNIAQKQWQLWLAYSEVFDDMPDSRWIQLLDTAGVLEYELCTSPLLAAKTLSYHLWQKCCGAVLTSATLTSLGGFSRLGMQAGIPKTTKTAIVQSPFDYPNKARFVVPALRVEPHVTDVHSEDIAEQLPQLVEGHLGVLVLFSSKRQLKDVYELLSDKLQAITLCQPKMNKQKLLGEHLVCIKKRQQSILFGLASLAEGVDLPGENCTHVIIAKLPFSVPDDPVDSALAEWLETQGRNSFMEISLPDASRRLIQACGRLIRTESDQGQITLMDKRILTKRYGKQILNALPPFKQILG